MPAEYLAMLQDLNEGKSLEKYKVLLQLIRKGIRIQIVNRNLDLTLVRQMGKKTQYIPRRKIFENNA